MIITQYCIMGYQLSTQNQNHVIITQYCIMGYQLSTQEYTEVSCFVKISVELTFPIKPLSN